MRRIRTFALFAAAAGAALTAPNLLADDAAEELAEAREEIAESRAEQAEERAEALEERAEESAEAREEIAESRRRYDRINRRGIGGEAREQMREDADDLNRIGGDDDDFEVEVDGEKTRRERGRVAAQGRDFDASLAESLAWTNQAEIAVSELAVEKAQNDAVRSFAEKMVSQHKQRLEMLTEFVPGEVTDVRDHEPSQNAAHGGRTSPRNADGEAASFAQERREAYQGDNDRTGIRKQNQAADGLRGDFKQARRDQDGQRGQNGQRGQQDQKPKSMEDVWADATAICLDRTLSKMKKQEGMDFDWAYTTQQWFAHTKALSELQAMQGRGSDRFNQMVSEGITTVQGHLDELEQIHAKLEKKENQD